MAKFDFSSIERLNIFFPGNLEIKIDRQHEWDKVTRGLDGLPRAVKIAYIDAVENFSKKLLRIIRSAIAHGRPPGGGHWTPLAQSTVRHYKKYFGDRSYTPWNRTGKMMNSIDLMGDEHTDRFYVGLPQYSPYTEDREMGEDIKRGMTVLQVAKMLEYGGGRRGTIPARPLFQPALKAVGGRSAIRAAILKELRSKAQQLGFTYVRIK